MIQWNPQVERPRRSEELDQGTIPSFEGGYSLGFPTAESTEEAQNSVAKLLASTNLLLRNNVQIREGV